MGKKRVRRGGTIAFIVIFIIFAVLVALVGAAVFVGVYVNKINDILVAVPVFPKIADAINTHLQNNLGFSPIIEGWDSEFATGLIELFSLFGTAVILIFFLLLPLVLIAVVRRSRKNHLSARIIFLVINYFINFVALLFAVLLMLNTMLGSGFGWLTDGFNKVVALFDGPLAVIKIPHLSSAANAAAYLVFALIFIDLLFDILCTAIGKKPKMVDEDEEERQNRIETAKQNNGYSYVPSYSTSEEVLLGNITMLPLPTRSVKGLVNIAAVFDEIDSDNFRATYRDVAILNALEPIYPNPLDELPGQYQTDLYGILDDLEPLKLSPVEEDLIEADKIEKEQEEKFIVLPGVDEYDADPWAKEEVKEEDITSTAAPEKVETNLFVEEQQEQKEEYRTWCAEDKIYAGREA
jgi:hypothetical protein